MPIPLDFSLFLALALIAGLVFNFLFTFADQMDGNNNIKWTDYFLKTGWITAAIFAFIFLKLLDDEKTTLATALAPLIILLSALIASASVMKSIANNDYHKRIEKSNQLILDIERYSDLFVKLVTDNYLNNTTINSTTAYGDMINFDYYSSRIDILLTELESILDKQQLVNVLQITNMKIYEYFKHVESISILSQPKDVKTQALANIAQNHRSIIRLHVNSIKKKNDALNNETINKQS